MRLVPPGAPPDAEAEAPYRCSVIEYAPVSLIPSLARSSVGGLPRCDSRGRAVPRGIQPLNQSLRKVEFSAQLAFRGETSRPCRTHDETEQM